MADPLETDPLARAIATLAHRRLPPEEARRTIKAALTVARTPAVGRAQEMQRLRRLRAVMNFGPHTIDEGHA